MKVWNVGAVKHGRNSASRPANERGAVGPFDGSLSRGRCTNDRCCPAHTPGSTNHASPACPTSHGPATAPENCETRGVELARFRRLPPLAHAFNRSASGRAAQHGWRADLQLEGENTGECCAPGDLRSSDYRRSFNRFGSPQRAQQFTLGRRVNLPQCSQRPRSRMGLNWDFVGRVSVAVVR
jgi:hypothetical protein